MIEFITNWIKTHWLLLLILSVFMMIISVLSVSMLLVSLPADYFTRKKRTSRIANPILRSTFRIVKNVLGLFALMAGLVMLFTPGQGILTVLVGVILCDFPGKRKLERKLIERPLVLSTINRLRAKYRRAPIVLDGRTE